MCKDVLLGGVSKVWVDSGFVLFFVCPKLSLILSLSPHIDHGFQMDTPQSYKPSTFLAMLYQSSPEDCLDSELERMPLTSCWVIKMGDSIAAGHHDPNKYLKQ